jgi:hypothetical protein
LPISNGFLVENGEDPMRKISLWIGMMLAAAVLMAGTAMGAPKLTLSSNMACDQITISEGGTLTVGANSLTASGAVDMNGTLGISTGTFDVNGAFDATGGNVTFSAGGSLNLGGTVTSLGTLTPSTGTVIYDGTDQTIDGLSYHNLTIAGGGTKTLGGAAGVDNTLNLSNGLVSLGSNDLTLGSGATVAGTPSASVMIVTHGTGVLKKEFSATGSFTYPVGDNTGTAEYSPVTLDFTAGTFGGGAYAAVKVTNAKQPNNTCTIDYLNRYWTVTQSNITGFSCNTTFNYLPADVAGTEPDICGGQYKDSAWTVLGPVDAANKKFQATVTRFSDFTGVEASTRVDLNGPATATAGAVSTAFTLTSRNADGNVSNVTADTTFDLSSNSSGTKVFYSNAAGTAVITQVTILNGTSAITFYYKDSHAGTPTLTASWNSGGTDLGSDTLPVTISLAETTLATSSSVATNFKDFKVTVTKIRMGNSGINWATIFSGTAELDLVNGGTFPGISDVYLPAGIYNRIEVTFKNSLPVTGTMRYGGTSYYTTAASFGGASNVADNPSNDPGSQTVFTFRISDWGALGADRTETFNITPITVDASTDYQPTLMFTISNKFLLKGIAGTVSTYYFELSPPTVSIVEP